jgi:uncharacterized membrane protein YedE/YeeE
VSLKVRVGQWVRVLLLVGLGEIVLVSVSSRVLVAQGEGVLVGLMLGVALEVGVGELTSTWKSAPGAAARGLPASPFKKPPRVSEAAIWALRVICM